MPQELDVRVAGGVLRGGSVAAPEQSDPKAPALQIAQSIDAIARRRLQPR